MKHSSQEAGSEPTDRDVGSEEHRHGEDTADLSPSESKSDEISPLTRDQLKYCETMLKSLKKHRAAGPFLQPVDPVALNIPDYFQVIKEPMDLGTMETKNYESTEEFVADARLIFANCFKYNPPNSRVYSMGKTLETAFDNMLKKMPGSAEGSQDGGRLRRLSAGAKRKNSGESGPVRVPDPKPMPKKHKKGSVSSTEEDFRYLKGVVRDFFKTSNQEISWPFLQPVDPVALNIPDYFEIIQTPMDLSKIRQKLEDKEYANAEQVEQDFRLMCQNCRTYNGPDSEVVRLCRLMEEVFDEKWKNRPSLAKIPDDESENEDLDGRIIKKTKQIQALQSELTDLMNSKYQGPLRKPKEPEKKDRRHKTMSFEKKRQLSIDINNLLPEQLGEVAEIIKLHNNLQLQDVNEDGEIELEIDSLSPETLKELAKYVKFCHTMQKTDNRLGETWASKKLDLSSDSSSEND